MGRDATTTALLWCLAFLLTVGLAVFQRLTGPTYPVRGRVEIGSESVRYRLARTHGGTSDCPIEINIPDQSVSGTLSFKRFKTDEVCVNKHHNLAGCQLQPIAHCEGLAQVPGVGYQLHLKRYCARLGFS